MDIRQATPEQLLEQLAAPEVPEGILGNALLWLTEARREKMTKDNVKLHASLSWLADGAVSQSLISFHVRSDADVDWWRNTLYRDQAIVAGQVMARKGKGKCITVKWCSEGIENFVEGGIGAKAQLPIDEVEAPIPEPAPVAAPVPAPIPAAAVSPITPPPVVAPAPIPVPASVVAPVAAPVAASTPVPAPKVVHRAKEKTVTTAASTAAPITPDPIPAPAPVAAPAPLAPVPVAAPTPTLAQEAEELLRQQEAQVLALLASNQRDTVLARTIIGTRAVTATVAAQGHRLSAAEAEMTKLRKELEEHRSKPVSTGSSGGQNVFQSFRDWVVDEPVEAGLVAVGTVASLVGLKLLYNWLSDASQPAPQSGE